MNAHRLPCCAEQVKGRSFHHARLCRFLSQFSDFLSPTTPATFLPSKHPSTHLINHLYHCTTRNSTTYSKMSNSQLWTKKIEEPKETPVEQLNRLNPHAYLPGTWLQLSPMTSPAFKAANESAIADIKDDISLADAKNAKFLTNTSSSRTSSVSSASTNGASRHPSMTSHATSAPCAERRELAVGRSGGLGAAFRLDN